MATDKKFSSALSQEQDPAKALSELAQMVNADLKGDSCDFAILFVSERYDGFESGELISNFQKQIKAGCLIGCNSSGVISGKNEVEMEPAVSVLAMHLPDVKLSPFFVSPAELNSIESGKDLIEFLDLAPASHPSFVCFADPMSTDVNKLLEILNDGYKDLPLIGGLASGQMMGRPNWLCLNETVHPEGAVGVALTGNVQFEIIVSQGCRPVGEPFIITKSQQNILYELASRPALQVLREIFEKLSPEDQSLAEHSLFVGLAMDEGRHALDRGDFLIRNIMGADHDSEALIIGALLETGQTLQFQLRDAQTSHDDLKLLLKKLTAAQSKGKGAVLVSCCGRGKGLYGESGHDAKLIQSMRGPLVMAGFFANGEFGQVNRRNYIHGYTSSLTIIH